MYDIILSGPTNSGKSTQAWLLKEYFGDSYEVLDVGQILRDRSLIPDETGRIFLKAIQNGVGAPLSLVAETITERVKKVKENDSFCILTFSRLNKVAADFMSSVLLPKSTLLISLEGIQMGTLITRGASRFIDMSTGKTYSKQDTDRMSDEIRKRLEERTDDSPEMVEGKARTYLDSFSQGISIYEDKGYRIIHIDGNGSSQEVFNRIIEKII